MLFRITRTLASHLDTMLTLAASAAPGGKGGEMAHVHVDVPEANRPIGRHGPTPRPVPGSWIRVPLEPFELPSRPESRPVLRSRPSKIEHAHGNDVDPALVAIAATFLGMVAIGLLGKGLAGFLFWLL